MKLLLALTLSLAGLLLWYRFLASSNRKPKVVFFNYFFFGMLAAIPFVLLVFLPEPLTQLGGLRSLFMPSQNLPFYILFLFFLVVGVLEEHVKFYSLVQAKRIVGDRLYLQSSFLAGVYIALGFSFIENFMYLFRVSEEGSLSDVFLVFLVRVFVATFAHVLFSGTVGYYYGKVQLMESRTQRFLMITKGLLLASSFHVIYNAMIHYQVSFLLIPLLVGYFGYLQKTIQQQEAHALA